MNERTKQLRTRKTAKIILVTFSFTESLSISARIGITLNLKKYVFQKIIKIVVQQRFRMVFDFNDLAKFYTRVFQKI